MSPSILCCQTTCCSFKGSEILNYNCVCFAGCLSSFSQSFLSQNYNTIQSCALARIQFEMLHYPLPTLSCSHIAHYKGRSPGKIIATIIAELSTICLGFWLHRFIYSLVLAANVDTTSNTSVASVYIQFLRTQ